jgi:hypothetical protein
MRFAACAGLLYAARRFYRNWGTTKEESRMRLPGDELVDGCVIQTTEGVWIDAPASAVWPWLVQMGQDRAGLYTYEALENLLGLRYHHTDRLHPEWQRLAPGDLVRLVPKDWMGMRNGIVLSVVDIVDQQNIVLRPMRADHALDTVWSFHLVPHWEDRSRLLIRSRTRVRHPGDLLALELTGPARALVTRGMLLGIKRRAQSQAQKSVPRADLHAVK